MRNDVKNDFSDILGSSPPATPSKARTAPKTEGNRPNFATESDLADFWSVSTRQVRALLSGSVIAKTDSGFYDVADSTKRYLQHLIASAKLRGGENPELKAERLRLVREQADAVELKNQQKRGELVHAKQVEAEWSDVLRTVRSGLLAVPGRVGARLSLSQTHLSEIDLEIRTVLKELGE